VRGPETLEVQLSGPASVPFATPVDPEVVQQQKTVDPRRLPASGRAVPAPLRQGCAERNSESHETRLKTLKKKKPEGYGGDFPCGHVTATKGNV